ncbi:MAG: histidine phosphatase family protein [Burkholderiaceae bacterium]|nr:histidine phosphatase family protein [Burkholderiaceae bacterium]
MAELYLVRHGQASFGTDDYDRLSTLGEQQSVWLGEYLSERKIDFDHVIIGTQLRHRQTAEGICRGMGRSPDFALHAGLNEYDFYALYNALIKERPELNQSAPGNKQYFYKRLKEALLLWSTDALTGPLPEKWHAFAERINSALGFIQQCGAQKVLVVSSGGPIGMLISQVLGAPANTAIELNLQIRNASLSQFYFNEQSVKLASFNNIAHLDRADRLHAITYG